MNNQPSGRNQTPKKRTLGCAGNTLQSGFTLIEVMVALAIGLILISGMITVFSGYRVSSRLNEAMTDIQESARFALDSISRDARMAGFQGCIDINNASAKVASLNAPTTNLFQSAVTGSEIGAISDVASWTPAPPTGFTIPTTITPKVNSHTLSLQFGSQETYQITPMTRLNDNIILVDADANLEVNDLAIISNCQSADLFTITAKNAVTLRHTAAGNQNNNLSAAYGESGERNMPRIMKFEANVYFVANTGRTNESGDSIFSLYRQSLPFSSPPQEMVEGVEQLRIKYGIRQTDSENVTWVSASDTGGDFGQVESIQIGLLMSSVDRVTEAEDSKSYLVAGDTFSATTTGAAGNTHDGGRRLRQAFNTTISIRNRR